MPADVDVQAAAVVVCAVFGVMVLAGGPRRPANVCLAAFLFLVAGNQAAESLRRFVPSGAYDPWLYSGSVFAALDPLLLYAFASFYPTRNRLRRGLPLVAAASF